MIADAPLMASLLVSAESVNPAVADQTSIDAG
jgi:hypothetical protein